MMRVLCVIDSLGQGGAERSLVDTLGELAGRVDAEVAVLRRADEGFEDDAQRLGITVHHIPGRLPGRVRALRRLVAASEPDVVHASLWASDLTARLALLGTDVPLVSSIVGETYSPERLARMPLRQRVLLRWIRFVDGVTARRVTRFHAVTSALADEYAADIGVARDRFDVAWRGRDPERFHPPTPEERAAARARLDLEGHVVLGVGRLEVAKGFGVLVEALPALVAAVPDAVVVVVGRDGLAGPSVRALADELGVAGHLRLDGHQPDVVPYLHAADAFALPSVHEGLAGSVIEAMLTATPVVTSDLPGVREVVDQADLLDLVPAGDATALAHALIAVLGDPEASRARAAVAAADAAERFSLAAAAAGLERIYEAARTSRR